MKHNRRLILFALPLLSVVALALFLLAGCSTRGYVTIPLTDGTKISVHVNRIKKIESAQAGGAHGRGYRVPVGFRHSHRTVRTTITRLTAPTT
jgi:hypothetical protein